MQKQFFDDLNFKKDIKNLSDNDEILAMGIEACIKCLEEKVRKFRELKNFLEVLTSIEDMKNSIINMDIDLFKLKQVLIDSGKIPFKFIYLFYHGN